MWLICLLTVSSEYKISIYNSHVRVKMLILSHYIRKFLKNMSIKDVKIQNRLEDLRRSPPPLNSANRSERAENVSRINLTTAILTHHLESYRKLVGTGICQKNILSVSVYDMLKIVNTNM